MHPLSLVDAAVPQLVSRLPLRQVARDILFEGREPFLPSLYLGAPAVVWALLALERRVKASLWVAVLFGLCVVLSLGRHGPVWPLLAGFPPFSLFRYPVKYMLPAALCWTVLVALGFARWGSISNVKDAAPARRAAAAASILGALFLLAAARPPFARLGLVAPGPGVPVSALVQAGLALLATAALVLWQSRRAGPPAPWLRWAAAAIVLVDAAFSGRSVNAVGPVELLAHQAPAAQRIAAEGGGRIYSEPRGMTDLARQMARGPAGWAPEERWILGFVERLSPLSPGRWGLLGSFDGDVAGLAPPLLSRATLLLSSYRPAQVPLLRMAGVRWVVGLERRKELREVAAFPSVYSSPILLYEVPDPLPPVRVVGHARAEADDDAFVLLGSGELDPRTEVVLEPGSPAGPGGGVGRTRITQQRADRLTIEVEASAPAWLVVTEGYASGWRARVDGAPAAIRRANLLFQAIAVSGGRHQVELRYVPSGLALGAALSGLAAMVLVLIGGRTLLRALRVHDRRRAGETRPQVNLRMIRATIASLAPGHRIARGLRGSP